MPSALQPVGQGQIAPPAVLPEPDQLLAERAAVVVDEVDQHVHPAGTDRPAGDLAPGHEGDAELVGPPAGRPDAGQRVVVGEGHRAAAGLGGQLRDPLGGVAAVRHAGVGVEVDHPRRGYRWRRSGPRARRRSARSSGRPPLGWSGTVR